MKAQIISISLLLLVAACSNERMHIIRSKVSMQDKPTEASSGVEKKSTVESLAEKVAERLHNLDRRSKNTLVESCNYTGDKELASIFMESERQFKQYMVKYSEFSSFEVMDDDKHSADSFGGTRINVPDFKITTACSKNRLGYVYSVKLLELDTQSVLLLASEPLKFDHSHRKNQFVFTKSTMLDTVTGLEWEATGNNDLYDFRTAQLYCKNLIVEEKSSWRLPTQNELFTLIARPIENRLDLFQISYEDFWEDGCHWYVNRSKNTVSGINMQTGEFVKKSPLKSAIRLADNLECKVKCVR